MRLLDAPRRYQLLSQQRLHQTLKRTFTNPGEYGNQVGLMDAITLKRFGLKRLRPYGMQASGAAGKLPTRPH